jgi:hypothetical protein
MDAAYVLGTRKLLPILILSLHSGAISYLSSVITARLVMFCARNIISDIGSYVAVSYVVLVIPMTVLTSRNVLDLALR